MRTGSGVIRNIFHGDTLLKKILNLTDSSGNVVHRLISERERHKVIEMTVVTAVAQMLAV